MEQQLPLPPFSQQQQLMVDELSRHVPSMPGSFSSVSVKVLGRTGELLLSAPARLSASPPSSCPLCSIRKLAVIPIRPLNTLLSSQLFARVATPSSTRPETQTLPAPVRVT